MAFDSQPVPASSSRGLLQSEQGLSVENGGTPLVSTALPPPTHYLPGAMAYTTDQGLVVNNGTAWVPVGSFSAITPNLIPVTSFGIISSATVDQTAKIQSAVVTAQSAGAALYFPAGLYIYSDAIQNTVSWIGAGSSVTELRKLTTLGKGALILTQNTSNIYFQGLRFTSPNTPSSAVNNAVSSDGTIYFQNCSRVNVMDNEFYMSFGAVCAFEAINTGRMVNNRVYTCYKDGFHITGASTDIERINNLVEDGGDDAFPVVGYTSGGFPGQSERILDQGNVVHGCKTGAAFKYAGTKSITNVGCKVSGTIPASYGRAATQQSCCAMNILVDGSFGTFGNEEIQVTGFQAVNCGQGSAPFPAVTRAIQVLGNNVQTTRNIRFTNCSVRNSASAGFLSSGNSTTSIQNLALDGFDVLDTSDPNGWIGTAGTQTFTGIEVHNTFNFSFRGSIADSGGDGLAPDINNSGYFDLDFTASRINKGNKTGSCRIINGVGNNSTISRMRVRLYVAEQTAVTSSGTQYFLSQTGFLTTPGMLESYVEERASGVNGIANPNISTTALTGLTVTASPMVITNSNVVIVGATTRATLPATGTADLGTGKMAILLNPGTAGTLVVKRGSVNSGFGATLAVGSTQQWLTLAPGESLQVSYATAGTLQIRYVAVEGL